MESTDIPISPDLLDALATESADLIESLRSENAKLRELPGRRLMDATALTGVLVADGGFNVGLEGGACQLLVESFAQQFIDSGAINYLGMTFSSKVLLPGDEFMVTMQKVSGKTPHSLRLEAEADRDRLEEWLRAIGNQQPRDGTLENWVGQSLDGCSYEGQQCDDFGDMPHE
jgi:hypothetical protein